MDKDEYVLFIDETGTAHPKDTHSKYYIVAGCVVKESERHKLRSVAHNIKFKYWGDTDIVFHSKEIGRKEGIFSNLKNSKTYNDFLTDLENHLFKRDFRLLYVLVDKQDAISNHAWNDVKIYSITSEQIVNNFLYYLLSRGAKGKIVIESATTQKDSYFMQALSKILSQGIPIHSIKHTQVKEAITSISFVTKNNYDTEEQIADMFAYAAKCHYLQQNKLATYTKKYEQLIMRTLAAKLRLEFNTFASFKRPASAGRLVF